MRPRSRQSTFSPAFASSIDMIEPTTPLPTTTASTGFILVVVMLFPSVRLDHDVLREARWIGLRLPELDVEDAHGLGAIELGLVEVVLVIARRHAGETDQFPAHLVAVAAVDRIGEETFLSVAPKEIEEHLRGHRRQVDFAL